MSEAEGKEGLQKEDLRNLFTFLHLKEKLNDIVVSDKNTVRWFLAQKKIINLSCVIFLIKVASVVLFPASKLETEKWGRLWCELRPADVM